MKLPKITAPPGRLLRISAVLTILALAFMVWSMVAPTPLPVMLAMSVGQFLGTVAFGLYGFVIVQDLRRVRRARRDSLHHIDTAEVIAASDARHAAEAGAASDAPRAAEQEPS